MSYFALMNWEELADIEFLELDAFFLESLKYFFEIVNWLHAVFLLVLPELKE